MERAGPRRRPAPPTSGSVLRRRSHQGALGGLRGLAIALVLVAGGACAADDTGGGVSTTDDVETSDDVIDVAPLASFVEERRERKFDETIHVENADGTPLQLFTDGLPTVELVSPNDIAGLMPPEATTASDWSLLRLLDVVPADAERRAVNRRLNLAVKGLCCPIVVVDTADDVVASAFAVHELTHQIDFFDLVDPPGDQSFEWSLYARAAFEGNAERIRDEYLESIGVTPSGWADRTPPPEGVPGKLNEVFDFSYSYGARFMKAIEESGGESAVDAALAEPPVSAEQVMFPEVYFAGDEPIKIERPAPTVGSAVDRAGTLGAFLLQLTIRDAVGDQSANSIVAGWQGDSYVVSSSTERTCLAVTVLMGTPSQAAELAEALTGASPTDGIQFEASSDGDRVDATRCLKT